MIFIIIIIAILLPLVSKNKSMGLLGSMLVLFIVWGLQYEVVNDWPGNLERWNIIAKSVSNNVVYENGKELEFVYVYLIKLFQSIGYFGWLILSAIFELSIIYNLAKRYVPKQYYWLLVFILMLRVNYGFLFINSNRQTLAVFTTVIASLILCKDNLIFLSFKFKYVNIIPAIILLMIAVNIHTSAIVAFGLIAIYFIAKNVRDIKLWIIIVFNLIFISRFFLNSSALQDTVLMYMDMYGIQDSYDSYISLMDSRIIKFSIIEQIIYLMIMNAALFMYNDFAMPSRFFALSTILFILLNGYLYGNLERICQYYYIYLIVLAPIIVKTLPETKYEIIKKYRKPIYTIVIMYVIYSFIRDIQHVYYNNWLNFRTILSAPEWI